MIAETIAQTPKVLLMLLGLLTFTGAVIGYCVALIYAKRAARKAIEASRLEIALERRDPDQHTAKIGSARLHSMLHGETGKLQSTIEREKELESQLKLQTEQVHTLEGHIETLESKQLRLSRDFASYKSSKTKELELAKNSLGQRGDNANLPTLSRRNDSGQPASGQPVSEARPRSLEESNTLKFPLSRDIDIPVLAESEIPDSDEVLDLDVSNAPGSGVRGRG